MPCLTDNYATKHWNTVPEKPTPHVISKQLTDKNHSMITETPELCSRARFKALLLGRARKAFCTVAGQAAIDQP